MMAIKTNGIYFFIILLICNYNDDGSGDDNLDDNDNLNLNLDYNLNENDNENHDEYVDAALFKLQS